jgi:hypothetical protein
VKHRRAVVRAAAALGFLALVVGCGSSTPKQATSTTTTTEIHAQLVASRRAATAIVGACLHGDTPHLLPHVEVALRGAQWAHACAALQQHHVELVSATAAVHGDTATVRVHLRTHDNHPRDFDEAWHLAHHGAHGWQLTAMPAVLVGTWDHHNWSHTPTTYHDDHGGTTGTTGTTVHHDDTDHHTVTGTTVHHDDTDHHTVTGTTVHHDETDHHTVTSTTVHHDDTDHVVTGTTVHHDENDH